MTQINRDEWLKALADAGFSDEDDQAALSLREFAELVGLPESTAKYRLKHLVASGKARRTQKRGLSVQGKVCMLNAWRLVNGG